MNKLANMLMVGMIALGFSCRLCRGAAPEIDWLARYAPVGNELTSLYSIYCPRSNQGYGVESGKTHFDETTSPTAFESFFSAGLSAFRSEPITDDPRQLLPPVLPNLAVDHEENAVLPTDWAYSWMDKRKDLTLALTDPASPFERFASPADVNYLLTLFMASSNDLKDKLVLNWVFSDDDTHPLPDLLRTYLSRSVFYVHSWVWGWHAGCIERLMNHSASGLEAVRHLQTLRNALLYFPEKETVSDLQFVYDLREKPTKALRKGLAIGAGVTGGIAILATVGYAVWKKFHPHKCSIPS
ncbi:MAG: hypothetical protein LBI20_01350 [Holosporales bacterium]|jgi:hypothetical protein|nr:hypothetical protein [Holosporales bacterium]